MPQHPGTAVACLIVAIRRCFAIHCNFVYTPAISNLKCAMAITTVFTNNRSQAIRLPAELRLPDNVKRVDVRAVGNERVIAPVGQTWDSFFVGQVPLGDDFMPERASQDQAPREDL